MPNPDLCADQCRSILGRFVQSQGFCVVVLTGSGTFGVQIPYKAAYPPIELGVVGTLVILSLPVIAPFVVGVGRFRMLARRFRTYPATPLAS